MRALIFTREFKEPSGEGTYSRNIIKALSQIYDDVHLFNVEDLGIATFKGSFDHKLSPNERLDVHFVGYPLFSRHALPLLRALIRSSNTRFYAYNFGLITGNDPLTAVKNLSGVLLSNLVRRTIILTTSLNMFLKFRYLSPLNLRYIPVPINVPSLTARKRPTGKLEILYLGQAYYIRFPYDKVLRAAWSVNKSGIPAKLIVRFSTRHLDPKLVRYT